MAEVQDEEQWLYGDADKEDGTPNEKEPISGERTASKENESIHFTEDKTEQPALQVSHTEEEPDKTIEASVTNGEVIENSQQNEEEGDKDLVKDGEQETEQESEQNGEKDKEKDDDDSSSDDEPTVTIGKIVKQPDIMRPPPPTHRAAPTSGLKEEDFNSSGKINGVPVPDYNLAELEEKPWRKPGADLSDYFNYGFTEDTWIKYCERQKTMRIKESGAGLSSLGITVGKSQMFGSSNIPVSIVNENSKYGGLRKPAGMPTSKSNEDESPMNNSQSGGVNTIQVMTADRRTYSNKVLSGSGQGNYDENEPNVGSNPAASWFSPSFGGNHYGTDFFNTPPPTNFFTPPPAGPWSGVPPNIPPPGWIPEGIGPPPPIPHHRGMGYFDEDPMGSHSTSRSSKDEREMEKIIRESLDSRDSRDRESRRHTTRRRSRSRSKSRHKRPRSKSRSRSPSHRHKRKKSKRERETD